ncbi:glycoside hydrolase family 13 protein [Metabacillus fastidiosus]|uniref:oligo-1,6-glucosidase n=1 Tax=Metabacillus fastidiosus TaxID=1458 RepID=A0ABU6NU73_9BACI|nr:alpha-glucosidase [Metabacillus fastidiosus]MED4400450.1 alpha-glucosidase [Metabacillus fastidiosus]MED4464334.1 alpha-glucosidase [Metabacillus fastidiosus]
MEKVWWKEAVVYQIYPRSFMDSNGDGIGDLKGIMLKLDYLKNLGVDVIWLSPIYQSPNDDNGYDISDYKKIMNEFGTMEDFDLLLQEIHSRGMKLVMDLVVNHSSDEHNWFIESCKSKDNRYRDYYYWRPSNNGREPNNWTSVFSGSAWQYDEKTDEYYLHIFSKKQPDLNWENDELRKEIYEMMTWWLEKGVDGFRLDVINFISKVDDLPSVPGGKKYDWGGEFFMNGPRVHEYLREMNEKVLAKYDVMTVGECPGAEIEDAIRYGNKEGTALNMIFTFEHMDVDSGTGGKWDIIPFKLTSFKKIMTKWQKGLEGKSWNSLYLNNHDQPRAVSRFGDDCKYRIESAKMLAVCLHMMQGTPYIYQGEEIGMTNIELELEDYNDLEIHNMYREKVIEGGENHDKVMNLIYKKGRDNARTPMQWDESMNSGFTNDVPWIKVNPNYKEINVKQSLADPNSIYYFYQKLIKLRKKYEVIIYGNYKLILENDEQIYAYTRELKGDNLLVITNFSRENALFHMPYELQTVKKELLISNYDKVEKEQEQFILLRPYEARVYLSEDSNNCI